MSVALVLVSDHRLSPSLSTELSKLYTGFNLHLIASLPLTNPAPLGKTATEHGTHAGRKSSFFPFSFPHFMCSFHNVQDKFNARK